MRHKTCIRSRPLITYLCSLSQIFCKSRNYSYLCIVKRWSSENRTERIRVMPSRDRVRPKVKYKKKMETERILLRPWQDSDAETLFKYASDPDVGPRAGWPPHKSVEDSLEIIRTVFTAEEMWAVIWKASGRVMEKCGFVDTGVETLCPDLEMGSDCPVRVMKLIKK